jgi:dephospho-CoA kinase
MRRENTQISEIKNEKGETITNTKEIIRVYFENIYFNKMENLDKMNKFLDTYDHPKLNQEITNHLNRSIIRNEIEAVTKSLPKKKRSVPD